METVCTGRGGVLTLAGNEVRRIIHIKEQCCVFAGVRGRSRAGRWTHVKDVGSDRCMHLGAGIWLMLHQIRMMLSARRCCLLGEVHKAARPHLVLESPNLNANLSRWRVTHHKRVPYPHRGRLPMGPAGQTPHVCSMRVPAALWPHGLHWKANMSRYSNHCLRDDLHLSYAVCKQTCEHACDAKFLLPFALS